MDALVVVRGVIARAICGSAAAVEPQLGDVHLRAHQAEAVVRLHSALGAYGGALLADTPGMGKTFTALAVARGYARVLVFAPAALRAQCMQSAERAQVPVDWCSG